MTFDNLLGEVAARRKELLAAAAVAETAAFSDATVPGEPPRDRLSSDVWTVAQIVEHVALVEELIAGLLEHLLERAQRKGRLGAPAPAEILLRLDLLESLPRYDVVPAFAGSEPAAGIDLPTAISHLNTSRERLLEAAAPGARHDCTALVAPHFIGRLNFYEWISFTGAHDLLHRGQVEERLANMQSARDS